MIVITNPPFSLFREFVAQLIKYNKKFLIIGNKNAITYKEIFPLLKENKMWFGYTNFSGQQNFNVPNNIETRDRLIDENGNQYVKMIACPWFTNLDNSKRHEKLELFKTYNEEDYPHYDNYDAIEVNKTCNIPRDYAGVMGVPITFLGKYNPDQFEILGLTDNDMIPEEFKLPWHKKHERPYINGQRKYARIFIRNKHPEIVEE